MLPQTAGGLEALQSVCDLEHDLAALVRRAILVSFWIYQWQRDLHLWPGEPAHFFSLLK